MPKLTKEAGPILSSTPPDCMAHIKLSRSVQYRVLSRWAHNGLDPTAFPVVFKSLPDSLPKAGPRVSEGTKCQFRD
jgi:hypothetical protein